LSTLLIGASILRRHRSGWRLRVRPFGLVVVSLVVYGWQFNVGRLLIRNEADIGAITVLAYLMLASHSIGLLRAWELLGAPIRGFLAWLSPLYELNRAKPTPPTPPDHAASMDGAPQKPLERNAP